MTRMTGRAAQIVIGIDAELLGRLDDWIDRQRIPPSRSKAVRLMIEEFLDREEEAK